MNDTEPTEALPPPAKRKQTIAEKLAAQEKAPPAPAPPAFHAGEEKGTIDHAGTTAAMLSVFERANRPAPNGTLEMKEFVRRIGDGDNETAVGKVRREVARGKADGLTPEEIKKRVGPVKMRELEAVTLSGHVTSGGRQRAFDEGRFIHSGWLQIDLDAKDMNGADEEATRDRIGKDPHILSAHLSPTGEGVKAIMRIPVCQTPAEHLRAFLAAEAYMLVTYGLQIDKATKDPTRVCFVTHDPGATWNGGTVALAIPEEAEPVTLDLPPSSQTRPTVPRASTGITSRDGGLIVRETGGAGTRETTPEDVRAMLAVIPPRPEYSEWLRIASAVWDATDEATGNALLNEWSPEERPGEYSEKFKNRLTDIHTGTLVMLAKEHGYTVPRREWLATDRVTAPAKNGEPPTPDVFRDMLAAREFDAGTIPPRPVPILMLGDKVISTPGNLTNIQAGVKAGKSAAVGAIIAAIFNGNRQGADTLSFSAFNAENKAVLHFDTEQSRFDHDALIRRAMTRAQVEEPPPWFHSYCLTDLAIGNRQAVIERAIEDAASKGAIFMILIDGVADICRDPNNHEEAFALVDGLHAGAIKYDCGILTVLHENPGSENGKMRGHLGSQLERKAETPLRLAKDPSNGITTVWVDRGRHCHIPKEQGFCFSWSDLMGMHVSRGSAGQIKASEKHAKFTEEAEAAFGDADSLSYSALVEKICDALALQPATAKKRVAIYLAEGITRKTEGGSYALTKQD